MFGSIFGIFIVVSVSILVQTVYSQDGKIFECTDDDVNGSRKTIHVHCDNNEVIRVNEAIYGRSKINHCMYAVGDCVEAINVDKECCGFTQCNFTIWRVFSAKCGSFVTFFRLVYDCIPVSRSKCTVPGDTPKHLHTTMKSQFPTSTASYVISTETILMEPSLSPVKELAVPENQKGEDLAIILGSAAITALLLIAIVIVIMVLKKYQWQSEKECFLSMFVGMCTRHPPDGCEDPDGLNQISQLGHVVPEVPTSCCDRESNNNTNNESIPQTVLTIENTRAKFEQNKNMPLASKDSTPKRKRKRNEPSPDIKIFCDSQHRKSPELGDQMSLYSRNILFKKTINQHPELRGKLFTSHVPHDITESISTPHILSHGPDTTAV